jgi:hypothetical protein
MSNLNNKLPYVTGEAACRICNYNWVSVVPAGVVGLTCPRCKQPTGKRAHQVMPITGEERRECSCGCQLFSLIKTSKGKRLLCSDCGLLLRYSW